MLGREKNDCCERPVFENWLGFGSVVVVVVVVVVVLVVAAAVPLPLPSCP